MIESQAIWQLTASLQAVVTVLCATITAEHYLRRLPRETRPARRNAALALILAAIGDVTQLAALMSWHAQPALVVTSGLPVCLAQLLMAGMVLRESLDR